MFRHQQGRYFLFEFERFCIVVIPDHQYLGSFLSEAISVLLPNLAAMCLFSEKLVV